MATWVKPGGVTAIVVECWAAGSNGSDRTNLWGGRGGGGGGYSRARITGVALEATHEFEVGIGTETGGSQTVFKDSSAANTLCGAVAAGAQAAHVDNITNGVGDTKYNGGDGRAEGPLFEVQPGGGGGGGADRYGNGSNAVDDVGGVPTGLTGGGGGDGGAASAGGTGDAGEVGQVRGGGAGGGGYSAVAPVPNPFTPGANGAMVIWNDSSGEVGGGGAGFVPNGDAFLNGYGDFPAPPAPAVSDFRRQLSVM